MGKKFLLSSLLASILLSGTYAVGLGNIAPIPTPIENNASMQDFADSELIITFTDDTNMSAMKAQMGSLFANKDINSTQYSVIKAMHIRVPGMAADMMKRLLQNAPFASKIKTIEKNYKFSINNATNDPYYSKLWAIENIGQDVNGKSGSNDADMDVKEAWSISKGSSDVVVAVLDTGVDYTHNDLADNMWRGNRYHGYDFAGDDNGGNDPDPMPEQPYDENGHYHGTHVAGIIGAVGDNSTGVTGVAQNVQIMALKVFRPNGAGYSSDILEALDYISKKIDEGVKVVAINASYGGSGGSKGDSMDQAIQKLGDKGVVFVAAAGNEGKDIDNNPIYPASYSATNIIAVAATDQDDNLASFSNYGKNSVDVAAPGDNIISTYPENRYAYAKGTSMAAPEVTGTISLIASVAPESSVEEKIDALKKSVEKKSNLNGKVATGGRVNSYNALKLFENDTNQNTPPTAQDDSATTEYNTKVLIDVLKNDSDIDGDSLTIKSVTDPSHGVVRVVNNKIEYTPNDGFSGNDSFSYSVDDAKGASASANVTVTVKEKSNTPPIAKDDNIKTKEDQTTLIDVLKNDSDADGDKLTITVTQNPLHGTVKIVNQKVEYTPQKDYYGSDSFKYKLSDGKSESQEAVVNITLQSVNDTPTAQDDSATTEYNTKVLIDVLKNDSDIDGDSLTIKSVTDPSHGAVRVVNNKIEYTPNDGFSGNDSFSYSVDDAKGASASANVTVTVKEKSKENSSQDGAKDSKKESEEKQNNNTNHLPFPKKDGTFFFSKNTTQTFDVLSNDSDADGDELSIVAVGKPLHGIAKIVDNKIEYTPNKDYTGSDFFSYTITDGNAQVSTTVKVMVTQNEKKEYSFPIIGENGVELPTKIIGDFLEKVENGKHIFELKNAKGEIVVDEKSGALQIENIEAPTPKGVLPAGSQVEFKNNTLKVNFSLQSNIKFN